MDSSSKKYFAEFIGTFALVFLGAGAVVVESHTGQSHLGFPEGKVGLVGIALAHGLTLGAMVYAVGSISGAHFNPAVSLAAYLRDRITGTDLGGYCASQIGGSLVAALCLGGLFPDEIKLAGLGTPSLGMRISPFQGLMIEAIITLILTLVILFVTRAENKQSDFAGAAIGATLTALILFAGPLTGAGANPARYLGPAIISTNLSQAAIYLIGPLVGAVAAAFVYSFGDRLARVPPNGVSSELDDEAPFNETASEIETLDRAQRLVMTGRGEEAAHLLFPLLERIHEFEPQIAHRLRSLFMIIEEEHGDLDFLKDHRQFIYTT